MCDESWAHLEFACPPTCRRYPDTALSKRLKILITAKQNNGQGHKDACLLESQWLIRQAERKSVCECGKKRQRSWCSSSWSSPSEVIWLVCLKCDMANQKPLHPRMRHIYAADWVRLRCHEERCRTSFLPTATTLHNNALWHKVNAQSLDLFFIFCTGITSAFLFSSFHHSFPHFKTRFHFSLIYIIVHIKFAVIFLHVCIAAIFV